MAKGRSRGVPVQFYLDEREHAGLLALAELYGDSIAGVIRRLIACAIREDGVSAAAPDPRQVDMF